jgi:hypothetical protein
MFIRRAPHMALGTIMGAAFAYLTFVSTTQTVVDAFEPDLEGWDALS